MKLGKLDYMQVPEKPKSVVKPMPQESLAKERSLPRVGPTTGVPTAHAGSRVAAAKTEACHIYIELTFQRVETIQKKRKKIPFVFAAGKDSIIYTSESASSLNECSDNSIRDRCGF